jgi:hypothetical protein
MTLRSADRVRDTSTTTGTGSLTISGTAPIGYRAFSAIPSIAAADTFLAMTAHQSLNEWEVGLYTYTNATTLARTTILSSSNAGAAVNFSAGTKDVVLVQAAGRQVLTTDQQVPLINGGDAAASVLTLQSTSAAGTTDAISLKTGSQLERMRIDSKGNIVHGAAALAVGATDGFMHLETCPGVPTGTPTAYTGRAPFVLDSVNNVLNFYSGGAWRRSGRPQSAGALVFYVKTSASGGNDANDGLTLGTAWATVDHAIDVIQSLDLNHQTVTVNVSAGSYACASMYLAYLTNPDMVDIHGDTTTPGNVTLSFASGNIYVVGDPWTWQFSGIKFTNATSIFVDCDGGFLVLDRCEWGTGTATHMFAHNDGTVYCLGQHTISGATFANHWSAQSNGLIRHRGPGITFVGTPNCTGAFAEATDGTLQVDGHTWTGSFTGKMYYVAAGGRIQTNTNLLTYFPGTVPGDDLGGFYNGLIRSAGLTTDSAGQVAVPATTAAVSTVTGALKVSGGVGIAGALYVGDISSHAGDATFLDKLIHGGDWATLGDFNANASVHPATGGKLGVAWNYSGGSQEMALVNCQLGAPSSFRFYQMLTSTTNRMLFEILPTGTLKNNLTPSTSGCTMELQGQTGITIANGANTAFSGSTNGSLLLISDNTGNVSALCLFAGGSVIVTGDITNTFVSSNAPAAGKIGIAASGGGYNIYNNVGGSRTFKLSTIRFA